MFRILQKGFAPIAILALLGLVGIGSVGTAAVADSARPGDALYGIDKAVESVRLAFATSAEAQARVHSEQILERIEEANSLANESGRTAHLEEALARAGEHIANAQAKAEEAKSQGKDVDEVLAILAESSLRLQENLARVLEQVPEQAKPAIERAMEVGQRGFEEAANAVSGQKKQELLNGSLDRLRDAREKAQDQGVELPEVGIPELEQNNMDTETDDKIPVNIPTRGRP